MKSIGIMLQLLFFMFCLSALGEPWRVVLKKFVGFFKYYNFLQILVLDAYLGGFLLYIIAVIPLHLFSATTLYAITLVSIVIVLWLHRREFRNITKNLRLCLKKFSFQNPHLLELALVILIFLFSFVVQTSPFNHLFFGSVRDTSIHSLFAQVLIENKQVPMTLEPYLNEGIIYPQGFTPLAAYSVFILNYSPPEAIFYLTSLFNTLTILGAYFLGKTLSSSRNGYLGLSLVSVFALVAAWPKYITWGSNPFVVSFPLYFICLSFFPFFVKGKLNAVEIFVTGIFLGYLSALHLQTYEMLIASFFVLWIYFALKGEKGRWRGLLCFMAVSILSLVVLSPFIYRLFVFYQYPYHNIGLPVDVKIPMLQLDLSLVLSGCAWLFENLAGNPLLNIASLALFFISILLIVRLQRKKSFVETSELVKLGLVTLLGELLIFLLGSISPYDLPFYPQPLLLYFPFYFFVAALIFPLYHFFSSCLSKRFLAETSGLRLKTKNLLVTAVSFMLLVGVFFPFLYQSVFLDVGGLHGSYAVFSVTTEQDLKLILWIRENLSRGSLILVNTFQSGTFIPSIANRKVVYPPFASSYSVRYQNLATFLEKNSLNITTLNLMKDLNITNVYVGSGVSPWDRWIHKWNPKLFLGNPNFRLVKNFDDAYLFEFKEYVNPDVVFLDDFEYTIWNQNGWRNNFVGNGLGNVNITAGFGHVGSGCLTITAQAVPTVWEWKYAYWVGREIFVLNNSDVTLSFQLKATEGFGGKDTFAVLISNVHRNQSMVITTPNGVYESYAYAISLDEFEGFFEFNGSRSLSKLWHQRFSSSLPNPFILELVNWDFDGVENVAYIDDVKVTSTPLG